MATNSGPSGILFRVRAGLALAAAGALLAACGSSSKGASGSTSVGASTTPSTSSSSSSGSSGSSGTNLGGGSFCDKARKASTDISSAANGLATDSPDKIKQFEQSALAEIKALEDSAPSEIKGAIGTLASAEQQLFDDLQSSNFDFTKVSSDVATLFSSQQFTQASQQIENYLVSKCGINPSAFAS
jgi:CO/xanthine dehydrogenase Mo-binding subunit